MPLDLSEFKRILVLSPHLDDAALSVGGIVDRLTKRGSEIVIATVFTADPPPLKATSALIDFLHKSWDLGPSPIQYRREEDIAAVNVLGARLVHGGLPDAIYRTDRDHNFLYSTRAAVFSQPSSEDFIYPVLNMLLMDWLREIQPDVVLSPLAVGRHVDHAIVSDGFRNIAVEQHLRVFLYEDMPYSTGRFPPGSPDSVNAALTRTRWSVTDTESIEIDIDRKANAILSYKSQIAELFPDARQPENDLKRLITLEPHQPPFFENIWRTAT